MKTQELNRLLHSISIYSLVLVGISLFISIMLIELHVKWIEIKELHEICGFSFFALIIFHLVLFRKKLLNLFTLKNCNHGL